MALFEEISLDANVLPIPVHLGFTARSKPLVAVGVDYFAERGLVPS